MKLIQPTQLSASDGEISTAKSMQAQASHRSISQAGQLW